MNCPLLSFLFVTAAVTAAEPVRKLVPRPIPGMPAGQLVATPTDLLMSGFAAAPPPRHPASPPTRVPAGQAPVAAPAANEPARILFVHRRDRLPAAIRQRLKALPADPEPEAPKPSADRALPEERPAAIRIIPKSEVPLLKPPSQATPP